MSERDSYNDRRPGEPKPKRRGEIRLDDETVDMMLMAAGGIAMTLARNRGDYEEAERVRQIVANALEFRRGQRVDRSTPAAGVEPGQPNLPGSLQVDPSLSPGQDVHQPEYYQGNRGSGSVLPPSLQTRPGPGDIHPPGYHTGGPGPYMSPQFRVPRGPFGK